ncbi:PREDICTED: poly(U)-specific endoribonuclease-like [Acropora digitifera]|uniref:poly(U)-specific endoribonuclease-like n=1 Tax=Acropora digitifera TaxID=70779 RepID=UPI00077A4448|nr:PREDICTED: poly(U)-specific endoribonuclease-like [Acropora digitifera]
MAKICIAFFLLTLSFSRSITVVISQKDLGPKVCQEIWTAAGDNLKVALELKVDLTNGTSQVFTLEPAGAEKIDSSPVFQSFRALLKTNNKENQDAFLHSITQPGRPVDIARKHLNDEGILNPVEDQKTFISRLREMWFGSPTKQGFKHVFVGEQATTDEYSGFHNWYQLYLEQLKNPSTITAVTFEPNSYTHNTDVEPSFIRLNFEWNGRKKGPGSSMFVGTSPAFDFAMFSLCSIVLFKENHQDGDCTCKIHNSRVTIRAINRNVSKKILTVTAFPTSVVCKFQTE